MAPDWLSTLTQRSFHQVKLVSIDAADVADGNASIILGLIWNIILFFQVNFAAVLFSNCQLFWERSMATSAPPLGV